jgi:hypothetical protein
MKARILTRLKNNYASGIGAGILGQSTGARNRVVMGLSQRPAMIHRLAESIPYKQFLGSLKV